MNIDTFVLNCAVSMALTGLALGTFRHLNWLTAFAGASILQASFTGLCLLAIFQM